MSRTWIFQANPDRFDIDAFLATRPVTTTFLVTRYREEVAVGDQVFIWRSIGGGNQDAAGIVAQGEVIDPPTLRPDEPAARPFWANPSEADIAAERVILRLIRIADSRDIIRRRWIQEDPILRHMLILRLANATNYEVPDTEAARLNALWSQTGRDWSYADSVAGLWAYQQTYGREVSRLPGSPVANTAMLIGRAVSGVYNKVMNFRSIDPRDQRTGMTGGGAMDRRVWSEFYNQAMGAIDEGSLSAEFHRLWDTTGHITMVEDAGRPYVTVEAEVRRLCSFDLDTLMGRYRATTKNQQHKPAVGPTATREYSRDPLVVAIGKVRSGFRCEVSSCLHPTFMDAGNLPYCDVHHIQALADGGADDLGNVACLCPAHHREVHYGKAAAVIQAALIRLRMHDGSELQNAIAGVSDGTKIVERETPPNILSPR
jgi:hypothetical protein